MTHTDIDNALVKAEAAARKAAEKAAQLREQAQRQAADLAAAKARVAAEFNDARRRNFATYATAAAEAHDAFQHAVTDGGDVIAAWVAYQRAQAVARIELDNLESAQGKAAKAALTEWKARCEQWNAQLAKLEREHGTHATHPELASLNEEITAAIADTPKPFTREANDTTRLHPTHFGIQPFTTRADQYEDNNLTAAIARATATAVTQAAKDHQTTVNAALAEAMKAAGL